MSTTALKAAATGKPEDITAAAIAAGKDVKPKDLVKHLLEQNKHVIAQALPKHMNAERLMRVAITSVTSNPALLKCYVPTLIGGIIQCSQMGLEPNTVLGHAYLIPYNNRKKGRTDAQVVIGYKGLIDLARRSGQIVSIAAHAVRQHDEFEYEYGLNEKLRHIPAEEGDRGEITHFYAVAHMKDGGHAFEVMTRGAVQKIRETTNGKNNSVWSEHFEEMGRKTVIRRLSKYLPLSVEMATAVAMEDTTARGDTQNLEGVLDGSYTVEAGDDPDASVDAGPDTDPTQLIDDGAPTISRERIAAMIAAAKNPDDIDQALDLLGSSDISAKDQDDLRDEAKKARAKLQGAK